MKRFWIALVAGMLSFSIAQSAIKVHTIGDSTMSWYEDSNVKRGWGMFLQAFFDPTYVIVNNAGHSGRDSRTFYMENGDWNVVSEAMQSGDYLLIQFGHNDEGNDKDLRGVDNWEYKTYCQENNLTIPSDKRGTNPQTTFRNYLRLFISEARAKGVTPILVSSICRNSWSNGNISRWGQHDLGGDFAKLENGVLQQHLSLPANDSSMSYVHAMREVGKEENVAFIDLMEATRQLFVQYGQANCGSQLFTTGDGTHLNTLAATLVAREAAQLLKNAGILAQYITIPTSIIANPASITIGETYSGVAQNKETILSGFGLEPAAGTLSITASANLQVSLDKESYSETASLSYQDGNLFQKVYIRALYSETGEQKDSVVVVCRDVRVVVPVTATVLSLEGSSAVNAVWALNEKPKSIPVEAVCEGPVSGEMTLSNMAAIDYNSSKVFYDGNGNDATMLRFHNSDVGCAARVPWPAGEIDENAERYIDFSLTAPSTMEVRVTNIELEIAGHSTTAMCCRLRAGIGEAVASGTELIELRNMANQSIQYLHFTPIITIPAGETLHVRILPWMNVTSASDSKYLGVGNVKIEGLAMDPSQGIEDVKSDTLRMKNRKVLENGTIIVARPDGTKYTLTGLKIND